MMRLEPRSLAAPIFVRGNGFNGALETGSTSQVMDAEDFSGFYSDQQEGPWLDTIDAAYAAASSQISGDGTLGGGQWSAQESGSVSASVFGPGTGLPGDPNTQTQTPAIQINVQHTGNDFVSSSIPGPFNSAGKINETTATDTDNPSTGGSTLDYVVGGGGNGGSTLTLTFKANLVAMGNMTHFRVDAELALVTRFMSVEISPNGLEVSNANNQQLFFDGNFESFPALGSNDLYTLVVPNVGNFVDFAVAYESSLTTTVMDGIPNGSFPNTTNFDWSLTAQLS